MDLTQRVGATSQYGSFTETRKNLRSVLDDAHAGRVTTVQRDAERFAIVDADRLVTTLMRLRPADATVAAEGGGWSAVLPGLPVHGDGPTFEDAVEDLLEALREYAGDWNARLLNAPNHRHHWAVVELVQLASDEQLRGWLLAADFPPSG
jgi:predicted RNase H-like HicB family nuclease